MVLNTGGSIRLRPTVLNHFLNFLNSAHILALVPLFIDSIILFLIFPI